MSQQILRDRDEDGEVTLSEILANVWELSLGVPIASALSAGAAITGLAWGMFFMAYRMDYAPDITIYAPTLGIIFGCAWLVWEMYISRTKQLNQQYNRGVADTEKRLDEEYRAKVSQITTEKTVLQRQLNDARNIRTSVANPTGNVFFDTEPPEIDNVFNATDQAYEQACFTCLSEVYERRQSMGRERMMNTYGLSRKQWDTARTILVSLGIIWEDGNKAKMSTYAEAHAALTEKMDRYKHMRLSGGTPPW